MTSTEPPLPSDYPLARACCIAQIADGGFPGLQLAWQRSQKRLREIESRLQASSIDSRVVAIALSGSLGRMEALDHSDADLIAIVKSSKPLAEAERRTIMRALWSALEPLQLPSPARDGIFTAAIDWHALCNTDHLGQIEEPLPEFGTRIQLLLDSQPVFGREAFDELLLKIAKRYACGDVMRRSSAIWTYLTNDLIRYYRCLGLDAQWRRRDDPQQWRLFNVKLAHSRRLLFTGLLFLAAESSRVAGNRLGWLLERLRLTPLERVAWVMDANSAGDIAKVTASYDQFLLRLQDTAFRSALGAPSSSGELEDNLAFAELMANADQLAGALVQFVVSRHHVWSDQVLASMML